MPVTYYVGLPSCRANRDRLQVIDAQSKRT